MSGTVLVVTVGLTFLSRMLPRLVRPNARNSDTYYHLLQAGNVRRHRFHLPKANPCFVVPTGYYYPPAFHYVLALFPRAVREQFEKISSATFDAVHALVFVAAAYAVLAPSGWTHSELLLLALVFTFSPALVAVGFGPRAYQGTARTLAELLVIVIFAALWRYWLHGGLGWLVAGALLAALVPLTSSFGFQTLVFFSLMMAFLLDSTRLLVLPVLAFIGAVALSGGHYWDIFRTQHEHLRIYVTRLAIEHPLARVRRRWLWPRTWRGLARFFIFNNPYGVLVSKFGLLAVSFGWVALRVASGRTAPTLDGFLVAWLTAAVIVFVLVSFPILSFVGEAERYLEYALIPSSLLFAVLLPAHLRTPVLGSILVLHLAAYAFYAALFVIEHRPGSQFQTELGGLVAALNAQPQGVVLTILNSPPWELAYRTAQQFCYPESLTLVRHSEAAYQRFFWRYPWPHADFGHYVQNYQVSLIAVEQLAVERAQAEGLAYHFNGFGTVWESDLFRLYRVPEGYQQARVEPGPEGEASRT